MGDLQLGPAICKLGSGAGAHRLGATPAYVSNSSSSAETAALLDSGLQLGAVIGKIGGGAEVHQIPVNFVEPSLGSNGMKHVADVPVPDGKQARVIVLSYSTSVDSRASGASLPRLYIAGNLITTYRDVQFGGTSIVTGPVAVEVQRRNASASGDPSFVGDIFWWEVDD